MTSRSKNLLLVAALAGTLAACKKEDETVVPGPNTPPPNEEELITTLILTFTDTENAAAVFELRSTDLDGEGGDDPVFTGDALPNNRAYTMALRVLNESDGANEEITEEIVAEDEEHQFFFAVTGAALTVAYADADADGNPIGLSNTAITGGPSAGFIVVTLIHEPNKTAEGVSAGDPSQAGGETDIEVSIPVEVQ